MYGPYYFNNLNQEQLLQQINNLQQAQANNPYMQNQNQNSRGDFLQIKDYQEVEKTPCRIDGTPTLFFDFTNMVFYSKKVVNGKPSIQTYRFEVLNATNSNENTDNEQIVNDGENVAQIDYNQVLTEIVNKLNKFDKRLKKIEKTQKGADKL